MRLAAIHPQAFARGCPQRLWKTSSNILYLWLLLLIFPISHLLRNSCAMRARGAPLLAMRRLYTDLPPRLSTGPVDSGKPAGENLRKPCATEAHQGLQHFIHRLVTGGFHSRCGYTKSVAIAATVAVAPNTPLQRPPDIPQTTKAATGHDLRKACGSEMPQRLQRFIHRLVRAVSTAAVDSRSPGLTSKQSATDTRRWLWPQLQRRTRREPPLVLEQPAFDRQAAAEAGQGTVAADHAMAGHDDG